MSNNIQEELMSIDALASDSQPLPDEKSNQTLDATVSALKAEQNSQTLRDKLDNAALEIVKEAGEAITAVVSSDVVESDLGVIQQRSAREVSGNPHKKDGSQPSMNMGKILRSDQEADITSSLGSDVAAEVGVDESTLALAAAL